MTRNGWGVAPNPTRGAASGLRKGVPPLTLSRDSVGDFCIQCPRVYPANLRFAKFPVETKQHGSDRAEGVKGATADIRLFSLSPCRLRRGEIPAQCCQSIQKEYKGTTAQFGGASGDVFSAICGMQIPRFTSSKPSKFAFASDEKSIRQPTTSFVRCYLNMRSAV